MLHKLLQSAARIIRKRSNQGEAHRKRGRNQALNIMATAVAPRIVGLEDNETTLDLPDSLRNTADAKRSFPAFNYAFAAGHAIALESDGAGALSIRVTNPGGSSTRSS